jgi:hypothetical protein
MVNKAKHAGKECPYYKSVDVTPYQTQVVIRGMDSDGIPSKMSHLTKGFTNRRFLYDAGFYWDSIYRFWRADVKSPEESWELSEKIQGKLKEWIGLYVSNSEHDTYQAKIQEIVHVSLGDLVDP